ncbi:MAG TPA: SDR family oxidoreductase [Candidatus Limnocylindria bacterium]|nr:SDR family oxidoreductase [Candidatus Limnocylindria bacterium]
MRITVIGASGLIGSKVVALLEDQGHDVVAASRSTGLDVLIGDGLADALAGADALVDVTNAPDFEADAVMRFFTTAATRLTGAAREAGVGHYVVLSIVGVEGLPDSPYMRAKVAQEVIIRGSGVPYTIVRATQFVEFAGAIVDSMLSGVEVRVPDALIQPVPADEAAAAVARAATSDAIDDVVLVGGPRKITFEQLARDVLAERGDTSSRVVVDPAARYFGAALATDSLVTPD